MTDYSDTIAKNFARYNGIVQRPDVIEAMSAMMNDLEDAGFGRLVQGLVTRRDEQAKDILFEAWICQMLRRNASIKDLVYEPEDMPQKPDFRFTLEGIRFDLQVKRLYRVGNAPEKTFFLQRFDERAQTIPVPLFLNIWLASSFQKKDIDPLFYFIKKHLSDLTVETEGDKEPSFNHSWPDTDKPLARFSLSRANPLTAGHMEIGIFLFAADWMESDGEFEPIAELVDNDAIRHAISGQLDRARHTLSMDPAPDQSNIVILQPDFSLMLDSDTVAAALYGDDVERVQKRLTANGNIWEARSDRIGNGLFRGDSFRKMCGLIVVPSDRWFLSETFDGTYYPQPLHLDIIGLHPKPFPEMVFHVENRWKSLSPGGWLRRYRSPRTVDEAGEESEGTSKDVE